MQASSVSAQQAQQAGCGHGSTSGKSWVSAARQGLGAGLRNGIGENNCFLNAAMQCLYRCCTFRHAIVQWPQAVYQVSIAAASSPSSCVHMLPFLSANTLLQMPVTITAVIPTTCIKLYWLCALCLLLAMPTSYIACLVGCVCSPHPKGIVWYDVT